jgi:hypothetical protein
MNEIEKQLVQEVIKMFSDMADSLERIANALEEKDDGNIEENRDSYRK